MTATIETILADAKANRQRLRGCLRPHVFIAARSEVGRVFVRLYVCRLCGGEIGFGNRHWYERGLLDGRLPIAPKVAAP
jgi:hypothetical protein